MKSNNSSSRFNFRNKNYTSHNPIFCWDGCTDETGFQHRCYLGLYSVLRGFGYLHLEFYRKLWTLKNTRTPPVEVHRPITTYLQFPIQVCFPWLSVCQPRPDSQAHFPHRHPYGLNSSIDNAKMHFWLGTNWEILQHFPDIIDRFEGPFHGMWQGGCMERRRYGAKGREEEGGEGLASKDKGKLGTCECTYENR